MVDDYVFRGWILPDLFNLFHHVEVDFGEVGEVLLGFEVVEVFEDFVAYGFAMNGLGNCDGCGNGDQEM